MNRIDIIMTLLVMLAIGWVAVDKSAEVQELRAKLEVVNENK